MTEMTIQLGYFNEPIIAEAKIKQVYDVTMVISTLAGLSMIILSAYFMVVLYNLYHACSDSS